MALFSKTKKTEKKPVAVANPKSAPVSEARESLGLSHVIVKPRITEKSTWHSAQGVYVFDVALDANKQQIAQAVRAIYTVTPRKVHIVTVPSKRKRSARTGKLGVKGGGKKAYVYLKKGETINLS
ncbi:MAG: 50S ribosomal protein L23 [bacterium]|nr:50S ribosomal protein L23 [bacterium]